MNYIGKLLCGRNFCKGKLFLRPECHLEVPVTLDLGVIGQVTLGHLFKVSHHASY